MIEQVVLVNDDDHEIGIEEKLKAHQKGLLHRAISVFIFNTKGEWLLQKRATSKYHSAGLWSNTCCSHPRPNEESLHAALRRLDEEMNLKTDLRWIMKFRYKVELENGLTENELDHVYVGITDQIPKPNPTEVAGYEFLSQATLLTQVSNQLDAYTYWFKQLINPIVEKITTQI